MRITEGEKAFMSRDAVHRLDGEKETENRNTPRHKAKLIALAVGF